MITIKKKKIFVFFFIIFLINTFLIIKRRDFNFYNFKFFLAPEKISNIDSNLSILANDMNFVFIPNIKIFLIKNEITEINYDRDYLKKYNSAVEIYATADVMLYFYPIKIKNNSPYIIGFFNDNKYNKCKSIISKPTRFEEEIVNKMLTLYHCE
jgi:hypothetical protein